MSNAPRIVPYYTLDDYRHWKDEWELIDGVPFAMSPSPFGPHERIVSRLAFQLQQQIQANRCDCQVYTNLDWIVSNDTVIRPGVMVVCGSQPKRHQEQPPTLMAEVLSDSTRRKDLIAKRSLANEYGVPHYVIIDPEARSVTVIGKVDGERNVDGPQPFEVTLGDRCRVSFIAETLFDPVSSD